MIHFNYSLEMSYYTLENALFWGNFRGHCREASQNLQSNNMGKWAVHTLIAAVELLPIISQIASLFEKFIITTFGQRITSDNRELVLYNAKKAHMANAVLKQPKSSPPKTQPISRPAKSRAFITAEEPKRKLVGLTGKHPRPLKLSETITFYPLRSEGVEDDYDWGAPWRCIQTIMSFYNSEQRFEMIFLVGGYWPNLSQFYHDKYKEELPCNGPWTPFDIESGRADPFIGEMILQAYNIDSELVSLHGIPIKCTSPKEVLPRESIDFSTFTNKLKAHFLKDKPPPVMIDNGNFALLIIGIEVKDEKIKLCLADPNIEKTGASYNGLYEVQFDFQGKREESFVTDEQRKSLYQQGTIPDSLSFDFLSKWLILFPTEINK